MENILVKYYLSAISQQTLSRLTGIIAMLVVIIFRSACQEKSTKRIPRTKLRQNVSIEYGINWKDGNAGKNIQSLNDSDSAIDTIEINGIPVNPKRLKTLQLGGATINVNGLIKPGINVVKVTGKMPEIPSFRLDIKFAEESWGLGKSGAGLTGDATYSSDDFGKSKEVDIKSFAAEEGAMKSYYAASALPIGEFTDKDKKEIYNILVRLKGLFQKYKDGQKSVSAEIVSIIKNHLAILANREGSNSDEMEKRYFAQTDRIFTELCGCTIDIVPYEKMKFNVGERGVMVFVNDASKGMMHESCIICCNTYVTRLDATMGFTIHDVIFVKKQNVWKLFKVGD